MNVFFEIISLFWQSFWGVLKAVGLAIWENLDLILQIKKIVGYFTPAGAIALYLGVPVFVISGLFFVIKKLKKAL